MSECEVKKERYEILRCFLVTFSGQLFLRSIGSQQLTESSFHPHKFAWPCMGLNRRAENICILCSVV